MKWSTLSNALEGGLCLWKYCLSFRKRDWTLDDYPVRIRKNQRLDLDVNEAFPGATFEPYLAQVMRWWTLSGGGESPEQARAALADEFASIKVERIQQGIPLPRPGTSVPLEFAPQDRVNRHASLKDDFVQRVLGSEWAWISDESSLADFATVEPVTSLIAKIVEVYRVDVSDIESGNIAEILERIAASRLE